MQRCLKRQRRTSNNSNNNRTSNSRRARVRLLDKLLVTELGVRQAVPWLELWLETRLRARSSEPGTPVASREGTIGTNNSDTTQTRRPAVEIEIH